MPRILVKNMDTDEYVEISDARQIADFTLWMVLGAYYEKEGHDRKEAMRDAIIVALAMIAAGPK